MKASRSKLGVCLALLAWHATAASPDWHAPPAWPTVSLKPGQEESLDGVKVKFIRIIDDSRCPADESCRWDGAAVAQVEVAGPGVAATVYVGIEGREKPIYLDAGFEPAKRNTLLEHLKVGGRVLGKNLKLWAIRVEPFRLKLELPVAPTAYVLTLALDRS